MTGFHRFMRLQLWRLAAVIGGLFAATLMLGVPTVVVVLEWTPMAICVLIALATVGGALARDRRRRR